MVSRLRLGIRAKFIILISLILLGIFAGITLVLVSRNTATLKDNLEESSKAFAALATEPIGEAYILYQDSGRIRILQQIEGFTRLDPNVVNVAIFSIDGQILFNQNENFSVALTQTEAASFEPIYNFDTNEQFQRVIYPFIENFGQHRYTLVYDISTASVTAQIRQVIISIIFFSSLALIGSGLITFFAIDRLFLTPLERVAIAALLVSRGKHQPIKLDRSDEIGDLAIAVSKMAETLQADIAKLQEVDKLKSEFMMIASHNLRTPITIVSGYTESLKALKLSSEVAKMIDIISANNQRLATFAEDMITIARIEAGGEDVLSKQPTDVREVLEGIATEFDALAREKAIKFSSALGTSPRLALISKAHFRNAVWNLLDNALKFTKADGSIMLGLEHTDGQLKITVKDNGIGIDPSEMSKLFTKFHRGTSTLEYNYEGTGIGLYVTKLILEQMDGTITAQSTLGAGSTFTISLPAVSTGAISSRQN